MRLTIFDSVCLVLILGLLAGLPFGLSAYDDYVWSSKISSDTKVFELTGHTRKGWVLGEIDAKDVLVDGLNPAPLTIPELRVKKGDTVVLKLTSSDVIHGFSLKDFGIFVNDGIHPGKPVTVEFVADKAGIFTFACNAICGSEHENMSGRIVVSA